MLSQIDMVAIPSLEDDPQLAQEVAMLVINEIGDELSPDDNEIEKQLRLMRGRTTVAAIGDEGQVLGTGSIAIDALHPDEGTVEDVAVSSRCRCEGIGSAIMLLLEQTAKQKGVGRMSVDPLGCVMRFYVDLGYQRSGNGLTKVL